ncbi:MAG TPA: hypothetical protein VGZ48_04540 [Candidatus Acidoferrales bacterium]|jgi:hypothetical protein|nr:hypothetical protein [Candidatus Acidoferrales bacterium]
MRHANSARTFPQSAILRAAILFPLALAVCLLFSDIARPKDPPWIAKDWTQWKDDDCDLIVSKSPWTQTTFTPYKPDYNGRGPNGPAPMAPTTFEATVQFRSALPVRQALLRKQQLENHYDKMTADKKEAFDQAHVHDLDQSDRVVVVIGNSSLVGPSGGDGRVPGMSASPPRPTQVALLLSDGTVVQSVAIKDLGEKGPGNETQYSFPRTIGGKPLLSPADSAFRVELGAPLWIYNKETRKYERLQGPFQDSGKGYAFKVADMMYKGKLEY